MIYTVTLNPSIDYIVQIDQLKIGDLNRMKQDFKLPGGKGINVSRILNRIEVKNIALGFLGGFTGRFIEEWLNAEGIISAFTSIKKDTRINIKLKAQEETEINGLGPLLSQEEQKKFTAQFTEITKEDIVILSGSIAPSLSPHFYKELVEIITAKGAEFVIDTTGEALLETLAARPLVIKPNNHELAELYQTHFTSVEDMIPYGKKLLARGPKHVLISLGGDGALLFTQEGVYRSSVIKGELKNSVGAGDSMIAGFVGTYAKTKDALLAFKYGVACGSATAFSTDLARVETINEILQKVTITKID